MSSIYNKYVKMITIGDSEFDVTRVSRKLSDLMITDIVFEIIDEFDLNELKKATFSSDTYDFDYFVCSRNKFLEIESFFKGDDLIMQKDGPPLLFGYYIKRRTE